MKTAVITGASSGIGLAASVALAQKGFAIIGVGHRQTNCDQAKGQIEAASGGVPVWFLCGDLMQLRETERISKEIAGILKRENGDRLEVLINNAGCVRSWYTTTEEGYEQQFALNHLAAFALTYRLLSQLKRAEGRVIMTGSESHKHIRMHWNDVMLTRGYHPLRAYKQSKLANILFAKGLNDRYGGDGITAYAVDPGLVCTDIGCKSTGGLVNWVWNKRKQHGVQPEVPARTYAFLSEEKRTPKELYYHLCRPNSYSREVTSENAKRLFQLSEKLCGISYPVWIDAE
ncbi:MAG: SDR family NAD(P)-dependent oxidoreductase [Christensenella sp.]|nr:SDR family NAD(P)-dependent oxidoreductase [Christensenella sp.]